ncbi:MAG: BTAD domain-containing putative transcriptional regulator [Chloroflexota bacterium]
MNQLEIQLFGGFAVQLNGKPITKFRSAKTRGLLAYLASQPDRDHARTTLATLLWGNLPDAAAKTNLRIELSNLKKLLAAHPALEITRRVVRFNSQAAAVDLIRFQTTWAAVQQLPVEKQQRELPKLARAVELCQGEFLAGFQLNDAVEFDEWQRLTQAQLRQQLMESLSLLIQLHLSAQKFEQVQAYAQQQLALEPWQEKAHQQLMLALALAGERGVALAQYQKCCQILQNELGTEPSKETTALYERILAGEVAIDQVKEPSPPPHNLTAPVTTYFGREAEQKRVVAQVEAGAHRLLTLVGEGGIGKSRLAQEAGWQLQDHFDDGVWFVPLASLAVQPSNRLEDDIATAIAAAMGQLLHGKSSPKAQLLELVRARHTCLLLDNFEHLLDGAGLVMSLLGAAPQLQIICTSREPLGFMAESVFRLAHLALPSEAVANPREWLTAVFASPTTYPAIQLFVDRAQRANGRFALTPQNEKEVIELCRLTAGIPLAIELAAAGMRHRTLAEQIETLRQGFGAFATRLRDVPARHRTVHAVFEGSWRLLTLEEQQLFASLSVFRGGLTQAAAGAIAGANRELLELLQDKSLLQREGERYWLHELLREFAGEKLVQVTRLRLVSTEEGFGQLTQSLASKHSSYFLNFVAEREKVLVGATPQVAVREIAADLDNIRLGWETAVQENATDRLLA